MENDRESQAIYGLEGFDVESRDEFLLASLRLSGPGRGRETSRTVHHHFTFRCFKLYKELALKLFVLYEAEDEVFARYGCLFLPLLRLGRG